MDYLRLIFVFIQLTFPLVFSTERRNGDKKYPFRHERNVRSMQHPAFSMIMGSPMAFPGNTMQSSYMSGSQSECITEDIVCPAWCLMEDDWGCKYCPCGPANGMSPQVVSSHKPAEMKHEENNDCIGTILCMLSCKDGYKLGPRDNGSGCQSCSCKKKNETKSTTAQLQQECTGPACSAKNASGEKNMETINNSNGRNEPCAWPLCINGHGPNGGPGAGASMTSLPGAAGGGGSLPGVDCIGPSCSAKNGMRLMGNAVLPTKSSAPVRPSSTPAMSNRPTTKNPKPVSYYRPQTQRTLLVMSPTKPPRHLYLVPVPTDAPVRQCATIEYCMNNCQYGFQVENSRQECPNCNCILPLTPPPPTTTTKKPDFIAIMRVCPDAVHCMKSCTQGYTLTSSHSESCPICTCNRKPKVLLLCERPLSCPNGCTVGYKGDEIGCPSCKCVAPSETKLRIEVQTTIIDSALTCNPKFSCVDKCSLGYQTGDNGCPTCVCLEPVTALRLVLQCEQPLTCPYGCTVGYKCDGEGCPTCSCIAPSETTDKIEVQTIVVEKVLTCTATFSCPNRCAFGFRTGPDGCPSCTCLQPVTVHVNNKHPHQPLVPQVVPVTKAPAGHVIIEHHQQPLVPPTVRATEAPVLHQLQMVPETVTQMSLPAVIAPSGIGCLSPSCSSIQQKGQSGNIFVSALDHNQHLSQPKHSISPIVSPHISSVPGKPADRGPILEVEKKPSNTLLVNHHTVGSLISPNSSNSLSAMEACPETVRCIIECQGTYDLTQRDGDICPSCKCIHDAHGCIGPSCSAPGSHYVVEEESTPSPGECVAILHCVMTCNSGYDIGEYSSDGCPTCTCVQ